MIRLTCTELRERVAEGEASEEVAAHLAGCAACTAFVAALREVDADLAALAHTEPAGSHGSAVALDALLAKVRDEDAAIVDASAARVLAAPSTEDAQGHDARGGEPRERREPEGAVAVGEGSLFAAALSLLAAAAIAVVTAPLLLVRAITSAVSGSRASSADAPGGADAIRKTPRPSPSARAPRATSPRSSRNPWLATAIVASLAAVVGVLGWQRFGNMIKGKIDGSTNTLDADPRYSEGGYGSEWSARDRSAGEPASASAPAPYAGLRVSGAEEQAAETATDEVDRRSLDSRRQRGAGASSSSGAGSSRPNQLRLATGAPASTEPASDLAQAAHVEDDGRFATATWGHDVMNERDRGGEQHRVEDERDAPTRAGDVADIPTPARTSPWALSEATTGLRFHARDGWWQSTYVPGDPALRLTHARLSRGPGLLSGLGVSGLAFAERVEPIVPLVRAPQDRALAVGVSADAAAIDGPTRVRVEVALRSVERAAGRRGPLRVAVVLDGARGDAEDEARVRALVMELVRASTPRDRVALFVSGPGGGELAPLGPARAGTLEVALRRAFEPAASDAPVLSMEDATARALESVSAADAAGLVLVVTAHDPRDPALERAIHVGTLAGITTSAIGVGAEASLEALDAIALAGQGRRRVVLDAEDAERAIRGELAAASELVARALRLRIRLAEGVELVDVIGSRPLDAEESARTRQVEQAIDRDLARRLGIASDRDDDGDGIRMLLPAFYANDAHTIVLDLVVTRPGHVLDVEVAMKDLVRLGNARVSTSLALPSGASRARGPRERRVLADALAHQSALALRRAADALSRGRPTEGLVTLGIARQLLADAERAEPGLASDASFQADRALLAEVERAANADASTANTSLHDAMTLAASRRVLRPRLATRD